MTARTLLRSFLIVLAIQAVAFALWPTVAVPCTRALCGIFNVLPPPLRNDVAVVHRLVEHAPASSDNISVGIVPRGGRDLFNVPYGAGPGFYFPNTFLLALVLATPLPWRRRSKPTAIAFVLLEVALAARIGLIHLKLMTDETPWQIIDFPAALDRMLIWAVSAYSFATSSGEFAGLVIWIALVAPGWMERRGDGPSPG
ncbi:MAG: hypothetical protein AB7V45_00450 [Candidatus Krumholzibacteriia bacterium]